MSLKMRVKKPVKFKIFETYCACIKFRKFDQPGYFACTVSNFVNLAKCAKFAKICTR